MPKNFTLRGSLIATVVAVRPLQSLSWRREVPWAAQKQNQIPQGNAEEHSNRNQVEDLEISRTWNSAGLKEAEQEDSTDHDGKNDCEECARERPLDRFTGSSEPDIMPPSEMRGECSLLEKFGGGRVNPALYFTEYDEGCL